MTLREDHMSSISQFWLLELRTKLNENIFKEYQSKGFDWHRTNFQMRAVQLTSRRDFRIGKMRVINLENPILYINHCWCREFALSSERRNDTREICVSAEERWLNSVKCKWFSTSVGKRWSEVVTFPYLAWRLLKHADWLTLILLFIVLS